MTLPIDALLLILLGGLCHATWNIFSKRAAASDVSTTVFMWGCNLVSLIIFLPLFAMEVSTTIHLWTPLAAVLIVLSATLHLIYTRVLQTGYRLSDYGVVYPLARGSGALFACLLAIVLLLEWPEPHQWIGLFCIIAGVFMVAGLRPLLKALFEQKKDMRVVHSFRYGLSVGGIIALYTVVDGFAVKRLALPALSYYWLGILVRTAALTPYALKTEMQQPIGAKIRTLTWDSPLRTTMILVGILSPLAYWFALLAAQRAPVSFVAPLREVSMLFAMLLGAYLLKEKQPISRIFGACAMVIGILFLV